jgi:hypothetical protein
MIWSCKAALACFFPRVKMAALARFFFLATRWLHWRGLILAALGRLLFFFFVL